MSIYQDEGAASSAPLVPSAPSISSAPSPSASPSSSAPLASDKQGAALRVQMELPVPAHDLGLVQGLLDQQDWPGLGRYLGWKHPRHRLLIGSWLQGGRTRGADARCCLTLLT